MLKWLKRRRELIAAEADEFMEAHGNGAYWNAREEARAARKKGRLFKGEVSGEGLHRDREAYGF